MKEKAKTINQEIQKALETVKSEKPLTVGLTNNVTINDCTNAMLAIGGTAAMFDDDEDGAVIKRNTRSISVDWTAPWSYPEPIYQLIANEYGVKVSVRLSGEWDGSNHISFAPDEVD